jgi:hypothetical protein
MVTCLHEKGKAKAVEEVGRGLSIRLAGQVAWLTGLHLVSYYLRETVELPHGPIYTPLLVEIKTHTTLWRFHLQSSHS